MGLSRKGAMVPFAEVSSAKISNVTISSLRPRLVQWVIE